MGGSLVVGMETRQIRGRQVMEREEEPDSIGYEESAIGMQQKEPAGTHLELLVHRKYSLPERPDVEIERTVWAYREKRQ